MFVSITNIGCWHNGRQAQPQTVCAQPAEATKRIATVKGNEDTLPA